MSTNRRLTAGVFVLIFSLLISLSVVEAGGWGRGPNFGGYHPFDRPIPDKPLDGLKQGLKDTGEAVNKAAPVIARPFEQTAQSIKDPWGWQKRSERWKNEGLAAAERAKNEALAAAERAKNEALDFANKALAAAAKETRIAIGAFAFVSVLAIFAHFFRRGKPKRKKQRPYLVHPLHA